MRHKNELHVHLQTLLQGFGVATPDLEVEMALVRFCKTFEHDVSVSKLRHMSKPGNGARHFLISFKSAIDAVHFANDSRQSTYGYNGVLVSVT